MAFDTVIDKAQLESAMTATANAIRQKAGHNNSVQWTSDKGFSDAILAIQTGSSNGLKFATGTITFNSNYSVSSGNGTEVKHNLGVVPDAIIIRSSTALTDVIYLSYYFGTRKNGIFNSDGKLMCSLQCSGASSGYNNMGVILTNSANDFTSSSGDCVKSANTTSFYFAPKSNMAAKAGENYVWYAIGG